MSASLLATCAHDGGVRLWDVRASVPLYTIRAHGADSLALCVGWYGEQQLVSGGSNAGLGAIGPWQRIFPIPCHPGEEFFVLSAFADERTDPGFIRVNIAARLEQGN